MNVVKSLKKTCAVASLAGITVVALSLSAEARSRCEREGTCKGPVVGTKVDTSYKYNVVRRAQNVTKYRDIDRPHDVTNVHRIVNVTRVQPVTHVNTVTRVHNRTAVLNETQHAAETRELPAKSVMSTRTIRMGGNIPSPKETTSYRYNTVERVNNVTRYKDIDHTQYEKHIHRVVDVQQVQPVIHTNVVTRIHDRPVIMSKVVEEHRTEMLPGRTINSGKVIHMNEGSERGWSRHHRAMPSGENSDNNVDND